MIRVAGGGPAGLAAAIELARRGVRVELHEARPRIGDRFQGDHQILPCFGDGPSGRQLLDELQLEGLELYPLTGARFLDGRDRRLSVASAEPYALMIRRGPGEGSLDWALARRAEDLGVELRTGQRLEPGDADIVATGAPTVDGAALELLFSTQALDRIDVLFDEQLTPGGYAYLFIRAGEATLGVAALSGYKLLRSMLEEARVRFHAIEPFDIGNARESGNLMNFALPVSARVGDRLFVGEAAGFQDYLFGLGIRSALISGRLAAQALVEGRDYDVLWRKALRRRMLVSAVDRYLYEKAPGGSARLLDRLAGGDFRQRLQGLQQDGPLKRLLLPWVRWRWGRRAARPCRHNLPRHWCRHPRESA